MQIITDDIEFLTTIYPQNKPVTPISNTAELLLHPSTISDIFSQNKIYTAQISNETFWNCLCAVKVASESHLKILAGNLQKEITLPDKLLIVADEGDGFIGYKNRRWIADSGNLHVTAFFKPHLEIPQFATGFTIVSVVSILQTLDLITELKGRAGVRWVNDIVVDNKKIGGVLSRTQVQGKLVENASLGIGLNVASRPDVPSDIFVPEITHIAAFTGTSPQWVFRTLITKLQENYNLLINGDYDTLWNFYIQRSVMIGRDISVYSDPDIGHSELMVKGRVERIGRNLEIFLRGKTEPVIKGRVVLH